MAFLSKVATVGCSIALLFAVCTFVVLGFLKKGSSWLRIKQHSAFCFFLVNLIVLAGVRSHDQSQVSCQLTTIILQYVLTVLLGWIAMESYQFLASISTQRFELTFIKAFLVAWGVPLPFMVIGIIVGMALDNKLGSFLGFYGCWKSDHVIWTLIIPCVFLAFISLLLMFSCLLKLSRKTWMQEQNISKEFSNAIRYLVHTSIIQLLVLLLTWVAGFSMLWNPNEQAYQIIFGIGNTVQGLFLFFFYCIFYFEENYHNYEQITLKTVAANIEGETNFTLVEKTYKQECGVNESEDENGDDANEDEIHGETDAPMFEGKAPNINDTDSNLTETTALVHSASTSKENTFEQPLETTSELVTGDSVENTQKDAQQPIDISEDSMAMTVSELELLKELDLPLNEPKQPTNEPEQPMNEPEQSTNEPEQPFSEPEQPFNKTEKPLNEPEQPKNEPVQPINMSEQPINELEEEPIDNTSTTGEPHSLDKIRELPDSQHQGDSSDMQSTPPVRKASPTRPHSNASSYASARSSATRERNSQRSTSRFSNVSFNSQMGMNELESLFNNPDLLSQANWKNRRKSNTQSPIERRYKKSVPKPKTQDEHEGKNNNSINRTEDKTKVPSVNRVKRDSKNDFFDFS